MSINPLVMRPEADPLWCRLDEESRRVASAWGEIARRLNSADDKMAEIVRIQGEYARLLGGKVSHTTIYRKVDALEKFGVAGVVKAAAVRKARGVTSAPSLPPAFVKFWRSLVLEHQRLKTLSAWRLLMRQHLLAGRVIPGYGCDWRGIWADENPGEIVPALCPYTDAHQGAAANAPRGWSYSNLLLLIPSEDEREGAAYGVMAMRDFTPSLPHTRAGLRPMQVITMDDVQLDMFCWYPGEREPRRPVGLGVLDVLTGSMVDFPLVPVRRREDGTLAKLDASVARFAWANILCNIGIDAESGVVFLAEHGTAGMSTEEEARINSILGTMPSGAPWVRVMRSSTSGAPILKGLFAERGRGRPTHKAMLEAAWNLLHNELAALPGGAGRNWATSPQDTTGWTREDRALIDAGATALATGCPAALETLARARTHALSYGQLRAAVAEVIAAMNNRRDHNLEGWENCGFVKHMIPFGGSLVSLDRAADDFALGDYRAREEFLTRFAPKAQMVKMSPREAWASFGGHTLKRFPLFLATEIIGAENAQSATVHRGQFKARNVWNNEASFYAAAIRTTEGTTSIPKEGDALKVWVNPMCPDAALVADSEGRFLGAAPRLAATPHGATAEENSENLGILSLMRGEQRRRIAAALDGRVTREVERRAENHRVLDAVSREIGAEGEKAFARLANEGADDLTDLNF